LRQKAGLKVCTNDAREVNSNYTNETDGVDGCEEFCPKQAPIALVVLERKRKRLPWTPNQMGRLNTTEVYQINSKPALLGSVLGSVLGSHDGSLLGSEDGSLLGSDDGSLFGSDDGSILGSLLGSDDGSLLGSEDGSLLGSLRVLGSDIG